MFSGCYRTGDRVIFVLRSNSDSFPLSSARFVLAAGMRWLRCVCGGGNRTVTVFAEAQVLERIRGHQISNAVITVSHVLIV